LAPPDLPSPEPRTPDARRSRLRLSLLALATAASLSAVLLLVSRVRGAAPQTIGSLAVLPFDDLSGKAGDGEEPYFADGIAEALMQRLASIGSLRVASRTSVQPYRGRHVPLAEIAAALQVDAVVEGTVQRSAGRVRISAKLVRTADDRTLWAETYERDLADVLSIQADVARSVADGIHARLTPIEKGRVTWSRRVDPEAYRLYLIGRYHQQKAVTGALGKAVAAFDASLARDPAFAVAYVGLAECEIFRVPHRESQARAKAAARKALELAPNLAEAHAAMGLVEIYGDHDWGAAEASFRRALELDPRSFEAHYRYSLLLGVLGRFDPAIEEGRRAVELEPLSPNAAADLGRLLYYGGRREDAMRELHRAQELDPTYPWAVVFLVAIHEETGRDDEAYAARERLAILLGADPADVVSIRETFRTRGYRGVLEALLARERQRTAPAYSNVAWILARLGRRDDALEALEAAFQTNARSLIYLGVDPVFDPLRGDPHFVEMLRRLRLPENARPVKASPAVALAPGPRRPA
jgi:TolB-like protein/tetratricopeptide (TPR) repeat protein